MLSFAEFARANGVLVADPNPDGRVHRCPTEEHPRSRNGAYRFFGDWGWVQAWDVHEEPVIWQANRESHVAPIIPRADIEKIRREEERRRKEAAALASEIVRRCKVQPHPYLAKKGFATEAGLVDADGRLVVPMRDARDYKRVNSVQWISESGDKLFLAGGAARGSIFCIGSGQEKWLCEGYATGLSLRAALRQLHRPAQVVVCFSAGNLAHVAALLTGKRFVMADHDKSGTGERSAATTGLPWVMPPDVGHDANDMHQTHGVRAVAVLMRSVM